MWRNRLCYVTVLCAVLLFFFCYNGYVSFYVLVVTLTLPFLSLLVSLPGMLGAKLEITPGQPMAQKGEAVSMQMVVTNRLPLVSGRARMVFTVRNTLTGETQKERFSFTASRQPLTISHKLTSPSCGQVICSLSRGRICDYMGLFSFPLRMPKPAQWAVLFFPTAHPSALSVEQVSMADGDGKSYSQTKAGDDPSEIFAFREYRAGDKLSQIHWKLSQKAGELVVKEFGLPISNRIFFLLDVNGEGRETDALLDVFATLSSFLSDRGIAHQIGFRAKEGVDLSLLEVTCMEELHPALRTLLLAGKTASPAPLRQEELPAGISHAVYLCCKPSRDALNVLRLEMRGARITLLLAAEPASQKIDLPNGVELAVIQPEHISEALNGFRL